MSSFLHLSKKDALVLNIGSGSVYGAIVSFENAGHPQPKILYTRESRFPIKQGVDASGLQTHMLAAVHTVVSELSKNHKKSIGDAHIVFSSPWFSSSSKSLSIKKEESFVVTQKSVDKLVSEHLDAVLKGATAEQSKIIERAMPNILLNGYETKEPFGKSAKILDVSVYSSSSPVEINKKIESEIYAVLHPKNVVFHTLPFVAWNVVRALFSPHDDFVFIDIGYEVTDILIVRRGAIHTIASFPVGRNQLIRKTALFFDTKPELAASIISLYANDASEPEVKEKVKTLVSAFAEEWGIAFHAAIKENTEKGDADTTFVPQKAFFAGGTNSSSVFGDIISKQIPNVTPLIRENLVQFVKYDTNESPSIFMILEVLYVSKLFLHADDLVYNKK